jgi:surface polysaccharide O-acyltransferase-like enzyme
MISGALLLNDKRELSFQEFFKKRTSKVFIPFIGWSVLFYLYGVYAGYFPTSIIEGIKLFINNGITYHFWFLYMIIGLYLITPLIKILVGHAQKRHIQYFLILWIYASFITRLTSYFIGMEFTIELYFVTDYVGYFILGYYLSHYEIQPRMRILAYIGLIVGLVGTYLLTYFYTVKADGSLSQFWYDYFSPNVLLVSIGFFVLFRYNSNTWKLPSLFSEVNKASFGIYIIHFWLLNHYLWRIFPKVNESFHPLIAIPLNILITFILSVMIIAILRRIPIIKKLVP